MRSMHCGDVTQEQIGQTLTLCGWADRRRDHGGVIFIDLRDHKGRVQVVVEPDQATAFASADAVRAEFCLKITGEVRERPKDQWNEKLATGRVEVVAGEVEVLNAAPALPFPLDDTAGEEIRLQYRYLDLRRPEMQRNLRLRAALNRALRTNLEAQGFVDVETPILTRATPEGARDYLVPSRNAPGEFYALPQSPQIFKQLLMMAGVDRYYQIARCFRDEDLRADRQPEFTQLDLELAFVEVDDVLAVAEGLIRQTFKDVLDVDLSRPFPRMSWAEAMRRYGSDKPDLRLSLELVDVADAVRAEEFKVFSGPANDPKGRVAVLRVPGAGGQLTRKQIDDYTPFVARYGAKGLAWVKVNDRAGGREGLQSPIVKFLSDDALEQILRECSAETGDLLFFGAGPQGVVNDSLGALRLKVGADLDLFEAGWQPLWVVDFPMFEFDERRGRWTSAHHPFTAPAVDDPKALAEDPGSATSRGYDMVLNGAEIGGGSIRIHRPEMQAAVFRLLDLSPEEADEKFGFLLEALRYGCPPHGGIAFGIDRIAALMAGVDSIRDVIAFPKTSSAACLLTDAPSAVDVEQLRELSLSVIKPTT